MFPALLVDEDLLAGFFGFVGVFDEIDFQLMFEEVGHGLGHKLVGDGLLGLVLVAGAGGEAGGNQDQAVLHVGKGDGALVLFIQALVLQPGVDLVDKSQAHRTVRAAAVFQPAGVMVVFQGLGLVGEAEGHVHFDLVLGLVLAVTADSGTGAGVHRSQRLVPCQFGGVVHNTVFIIVGDLLRPFPRTVVEHQGHSGVDHGLPLEHIPEGLGRNGNVGENIGIRHPADDGTGAAAAEGLLFQAAHVLAFFEVQMIVEAVTVNVGGHPGAGVLGGAQTQAVEAQGEIIGTAALAVLAAGVEFAENQVPVPALFGLVVIHRNAAAEILDLHAVVRIEGDVDLVAVTVPGFVDGVGDDLKDGMGAALHTVGTENNGGTLADAVGAFQTFDAFVAVNLFFCHAASP